MLQLPSGQAMLEWASETVGALKQGLGDDAWMVPALGVLLLLFLMLPSSRARTQRNPFWVPLFAGGAVAAGLGFVVVLPH